MSPHTPGAPGPEWLETSVLCRSLAISRSTLDRWRRRGLLRPGQHWARKNPAAPRSDLLWHHPRCAALLASTRDRYPRCMAEPIQELTIEQAADYVLLHRDTGTALYRTRATEAEIHQANRNLSRSGNRNRYVAARHFGPHAKQREG
jgi:hypothetical protein